MCGVTCVSSCVSFSRSICGVTCVSSCVSFSRSICGGHVSLVVCPLAGQFVM